jgi:hypothetical protein
MASLEFKIEIILLWDELDTDCRECNVCKERIYSKMYNLVFYLGNSYDLNKSDLFLCKSCKNYAD